MLSFSGNLTILNNSYTVVTGNSPVKVSGHRSLCHSLIHLEGCATFDGTIEVSGNSNTSSVTVEYFVLFLHLITQLFEYACRKGKFTLLKDGDLTDDKCAIILPLPPRTHPKGISLEYSESSLVALFSMCSISGPLICILVPLTFRKCIVQFGSHKFMYYLIRVLTRNDVSHDLLFDCCSSSSYVLVAEW